MAMVVQHNMQAMNSNRVLGGTTLAQAKSTEKLSSGFRINRAADDAAGLTISEKMRKQIKGLNRASKNAQDGISAVQTAEGALTEVHSMLQRMNELSTQAANGTNSKSDRDAIQSEIGQLTTEIDRVAETTKFNETYLLKGDKGTKEINLPAHKAGLKGTLTDKGDGSATFTMDDLEVGKNVMIGGKEYKIGEKDAETKVVDDLKIALHGDKGVDFKKGEKIIYNGKEYTYHVKDEELCKGNDKKLKAPGFYTDEDLKNLTPAEADKPENKHEFGQGKDLSTVANKNGAVIKANGKEIHVIKGGKDVEENDPSVISLDEAKKYVIKELTDANKIGNTEGKVEVAQGATDNTFEIKQVAKAKVANTLSFNLHVGSDADMTNKINVNVEAMTSAYLGVKGLDVSDDSGNTATYAIDSIGDAISKVSAQRSSLGAIQNRLEHTIANLDNISENTTAAESRIRDTDMASEMVEYSKNNILKQAGTSMLAQANQSSQGVLALLQ